MSGKAFRDAINSNFQWLESKVTDASAKATAAKSGLDSMVSKENGVESDVNDLKSQHQKLLARINNIFVTTATDTVGTTHIPEDGNSTITLVGNENFEQVTEAMNSAIQNIIKGQYLSQGNGIVLSKSDSGVVISLSPTANVGSSVDKDWQHSNYNFIRNWDWRHPSSHRGVYRFIKEDTSVETKAHPSIDDWEINFSNSQGVGYSFYDEEESIYAAYQGTSPTDDGTLSSYATISQSFPDDWGDFLIGKKMTFSVAVSDSYAEYQNAQFYVYSYTFTAQQGYTGWLQFPYPQNMQFGIHFNTNYNDHIENEITLRFHNLWVHALKLEIGETETLSTDLMHPCDCYKQARDCEETIQSIMLDGLTHVDQMDGYTGSNVVSPFAEIQNIPAYISDNNVYVNIPTKKPFFKEPTIEIYDANGKEVTSMDNLIRIRVNGTPLYGTVQMSNYAPGSPYIQLRTNITTDQIRTALNLDADANLDGKIYSLNANIYYNLIFTCEERWE